MGELVEGETEGSALPRTSRWLQLDQRAIDGSGSGSESPMNAVHGSLLLSGRKGAPGNLLGKHNGRRRLPLNARWKQLLGEGLGAGAGKSADHACHCAF